MIILWLAAIWFPCAYGLSLRCEASTREETNLHEPKRRRTRKGSF